MRLTFEADWVRTRTASMAPDHTGAVQVVNAAMRHHVCFAANLSARGAYDRTVQQGHCGGALGACYDPSPSPNTAGAA
jgi:hypothetical protein